MPFTFLCMTATSKCSWWLPYSVGNSWIFHKTEKGLENKHFTKYSAKFYQFSSAHWQVPFLKSILSETFQGSQFHGIGDSQK